MTDRILYEFFSAAWQGRVPCLFRQLTGLYCPGCGGTRAVKALLEGHVLLSILYHPLVPYLAAAAAVWLIGLLVLRGRKKAFAARYAGNALFIGIGLLLANWILKNYFLLFRDTDLLKLLDDYAKIMK